MKATKFTQKRYFSRKIKSARKYARGQCHSKNVPHPCNCKKYTIIYCSKLVINTLDRRFIHYGIPILIYVKDDLVKFEFRYDESEIEMEIDKVQNCFIWRNRKKL